MMNKRVVVQVFLFAVFISMFIILPSVSLQGICPYGGITALYILLTTGTMISSITIAVIVMSLLFGSIFCGWICPLGTIQDFISRITKKLHVKKYNNIVPSSIDRYLRFSRYILLLLVIFFSIFKIYNQFYLFCVYHSIAGIWTAFYAIGGFVIFALIIIFTSFLIERPWCKYLCPYGALLGLTNKFRFFTLKRKALSCVNCKKCDNLCPMNVPVSKKTIINDVQCISCLKCTSENICPVKDTVSLQKGVKNVISLKHKTISILIICFVSVSLLLGYFQVYSSSQELSVSFSHHTNGADPILRDGTYSGISMAYRPGFRILVTIKNNKITNIEVVSHHETTGYYEESFYLIPKLIIESQSTNVDSITGATDTGEGIKKAVENALRKAIID